MARTTRRVLDMALGAAKNLKSFGATSWKYLKVEAVPPLTESFFNGRPGQKLENFASNIANGLIRSLDNRIKQMDAEAERKRLEILAALRAHEEKLKADAKKKEAERVKAAALKAAKEAKKAAALAEQRKAEAEAQAKEKEKKESQGKPKQETTKRKPKDKSKRRKKPRK